MPSWERTEDAQEMASLGAGLEDLYEDLRWMAEQFPEQAVMARTMQVRVGDLLRAGGVDVPPELAFCLSCGSNRKQEPQYQDGAATGWFTCGQCSTRYKVDAPLQYGSGVHAAAPMARWPRNCKVCGEQVSKISSGQGASYVHTKTRLVAAVGTEV